MKNFPEIGLVRHANSGEAAMGMITSEHWDIVVIDADTADAHLTSIVGKLSSCHQTAAVMVKHNCTSASAASPVPGVDEGNNIYIDYGSDKVCAMLRQCIDALPPACKCCGNQCTGNDTAKAETQAIVLSPRESVVLGCIARGMTTKEIAKELFVSTNTVNTHRQHLLDKFGARNMVDLVIRAIGKGLVTV